MACRHLSSKTELHTELCDSLTDSQTNVCLPAALGRELHLVLLIVLSLAHPQCLAHSRASVYIVWMSE